MSLQKRLVKIKDLISIVLSQMQQAITARQAEGATAAVRIIKQGTGGCTSCLMLEDEVG
jgi:CHASE3 domain sensor protein